MNNQQGPTAQQMDLCSMLCASLGVRGLWGRLDTCICMAESLHCSPQTITILIGYQFSLVAQQCLTPCEPWIEARQASLSIINSQSLLKLMSIESVMPSNHFILCYPLLILPLIFLSIRVFSNESVLHIRWPNYGSFSFSISPSNDYSGLISFKTDWFDLLLVQGNLGSLKKPCKALMN